MSDASSKDDAPETAAKGEAEADDPKPRDKWDKFGVLGRSLSPLFAALAVASIGFFGQQALADRNRTELFTQLMSQREQAESGLRGSMFTTILGEFFRQGADTDSSEVRRISEQLLKLELLALNFGESLSLSPLFRQLDRDVHRLQSGGIEDFFVKVELEGVERRLRSLAKRVSDWQLAVLGSQGYTFDIAIDYSNSEPPYPYPQDRGYVVYPYGEAQRGYQFEFSDLDEEYGTVRVILIIDTLDENGQWVDYELPQRSFKLDYFDFPMIDNTRLPSGDRFALVLRRLERDEDGNAALLATAVCFPGLLTSQRDKPIFNEMLMQLKSKEE